MGVVTRSVTDYSIISADTHVLEPEDLWTARVPAKFKDRVPRIEWLPQGGAWIIEGCSEPIAFGFTQSAGRDPEDLVDWLPKEEAQIDIWGDPEARLGILDADGVDAEVIFPNRPFQGVAGNTDAELHNLMVRVYNDFISEFCAFAPSRLGGMAAIPNRGVEAAVAEVERAAQLPGIVGFLLTAYPHGSTAISEEDDPVWAAVEASGKPLAIHVMLDDKLPYQLAANTLPGTGHFYDCPNRMLELIFSGIFERFPNLQINFHEVDTGWIPYFADQADDNYMRHVYASLRDEKLAHMPSYYVRHKFGFSFVHDPYGIDNRHRIGVDRMMWSNDYPHIASDWPFSWKTINAQFAQVPDDERHAILAGNALRFYKFDT